MMSEFEQTPGYDILLREYESAEVDLGSLIRAPPYRYC